MRAPLSRAAIDSVNDGTVTLKLPDKWSADKLREHANLLEGAIADVLGSRLTVAFQVVAAGAKPPAADPATEADEDPSELLNYAAERIRE